LAYAFGERIKVGVWHQLVGSDNN